MLELRAPDLVPAGGAAPRRCSPLPKARRGSEEGHGSRCRRKISDFPIRTGSPDAAEVIVDKFRQ
jgi:hypothetical protein